MRPGSVPAIAIPRSAPSSIAMPDVTATPCPVRSPTLNSVSPSASWIASYQSPPINALVDEGR